MEFDKLNKKLIKDFDKNLKNKGVIYPSGLRLYGLLCLFYNLNKPVTQNELAEWYEEFDKIYDRQLRHIANDGWYVVTGNTRSTNMEIDNELNRDQLKLVSTKIPNPIWSSNNQKRENFLNSKDWNEIINTFKDRGCAVCGRKNINYDKGHLLLDKAYQVGNIVPMCTPCNNWGQMYNLEFKLDDFLVARPILK